MRKKKAKKSRVAGKKDTKGKSKQKLNPAEVREDISQAVLADAMNMTQSVIGQGKMGALPQYKYLLEVAKVFPPMTDGSEVSKREESLAETLLDRLGIPKDPVVADQYENEDMVTIPANVVRDEKLGEEDEEVPACVGAEKS